MGKSLPNRSDLPDVSLNFETLSWMLLRHADPSGPLQGSAFDVISPPSVGNHPYQDGVLIANATQQHLFRLRTQSVREVNVLFEAMHTCYAGGVSVLDNDTSKHLTKRVQPMQISLLHTSDVHVGTFDHLFSECDEQVSVIHRVRPDLLDRARRSGLDTVRDETLAELDAISAADAVICTCSTLGPIADDAAHFQSHIFRIDRPVMELACAAGEKVMLAICLESTQDATLALVQQCATGLGRSVRPRLVHCAAAWPHFESGNMDGFALEIARAISEDIAEHSMPDCVVLAQASMRVAEGLLADLPVPVLSSPALAVRHAIDVAKSRRVED